MRIAVFYNLDFGGAKRAVFEQVKRLKGKGHFIDVYTTDPEDDIFDLKKVSDNFYRYEFDFKTGNIFFLSRLLKDIKTFIFYKNLHKKISSDIDKNNYDIVLCHPDKVTQSPFLLRFLKTKNVYYCQEPLRIAYEYVLRIDKKIGKINYIYEQITRQIRKKIDLENVRSASFTIASCFHIRERMIEIYGVWPKVSYLGIDEKIFRPIKTKKKNQVLFLGNKDVFNDGYDLASKVVSLIPKKNRPRIIVVPWRKNNNERLTDEELVKFYNESLATFSLSRFETFGLTPLESLSCGTPVIATNVSGHRETVQSGKGGYLVEFDPVSIKDNFEKAVRNRKLGQEGRKYILDNWTWTKKADELEKQLYWFLKHDAKK